VTVHVAEPFTTGHVDGVTLSVLVVVVPAAVIVTEIEAALGGTYDGERHDAAGAVRGMARTSVTVCVVVAGRAEGASPPDVPPEHAQTAAAVKSMAGTSQRCCAIRVPLHLAAARRPLTREIV
jgi:hypothetical protein